MLKKSILFIIFFNTGFQSYASCNRLVTLSDFSYQGAFRFPLTGKKAKSLKYSEGKIAYNHSRHSIFISNSRKYSSIAEFSIPEIINSTDFSQIKSAEKQIQKFTPVLKQIENLENINYITGMIYDKGKLYINAEEYYDANTNNTDTSLIIENGNNIEHSEIKGFFKLEGKAHAAGWISKIPECWQSQLEGSYISGNASNTPISSRHSVGPSAFLIEAITPNTKIIKSTPLLDFSTKTPLHEDQYNKSGLNNIWNVISEANYGLIIPNSRTYATFGSTGGLTSPIGYKIKQSTGRKCGGACAYLPEDYYNYYWLWDVNDLILAAKGKKSPSSIRPYEYGKFPTPFQSKLSQPGKYKFNKIGGGAYDETSDILYLSIKNADTKYKYNPMPMILLYKISTKPSK